MPENHLAVLVHPDGITADVTEKNARDVVSVQSRGDDAADLLHGCNFFRSDPDPGIAVQSAVHDIDLLYFRVHEYIFRRISRDFRAPGKLQR